MKRFLIGFMTLLFLFGIAVSVQAADVAYNGALTGVLGTESGITANYQLPGNFGLNGDFKDNILKAGVTYRLSDIFGVKTGVRYDVTQKTPNMYGGLNFMVPFGTIKFCGSYDQNVNGIDWASYETSFRIQMYENLFIYAGIRGDGGAGAPVYEYNPSGDPLLFIKVDFNYQWPKIELNLQPLLYVQGKLLNNHSLKYNFNDRTALFVNINDLYDAQLKYGLGMQWKF